MTVLVDTSAWIEYLRATGSRQHRWLRAAVEEGTSLAWTEPILHELMAGARSTAQAESLRSLLLRGPFVALEGIADWEDAAALFRGARQRGLTVRSTVDCLVAAVALRTSTPILARDRDFEVLQQVSGLELIEP